MNRDELKRIKARTLSDVGLLALKFADAAQDVVHCKQVLEGGYAAWREEAGFYDFMEKDSPEWNHMMAATDAEYRALEAAKGRERRAKVNLMKAANDIKGEQEKLREALTDCLMLLHATGNWHGSERIAKAEAALNRGWEGA